MDILLRKQPYIIHCFWAVSTLIFVGAFMTLADITVFSWTSRHVFLGKVEERQGQVPGLVAYLVKTACGQCDDSHRGTVTAPAMNAVFFSTPPTALVSLQLPMLRWYRPGLRDS